MLKKFVQLIFFLSCLTLWSQDVKWATKVVEFSSQLSPTQYSAQQVIGKPDVLPNFGESPNAWLPKRPDKDEFLKVSFDGPIRIQQIAIAESFNPTAITEVILYDESDQEFLINSFEPRILEAKGRMLNFFFDMTPYKVTAVKVKLKCAQIPGYNGIDAIGISASNVPIKATLNLTDEFGTGLYAERLGKNVNSDYNDIKPLIHPDGLTLYFSRQNHPDNVGGIEDSEDIWVSRRDTETGDWKLAENIGAPLNTSGPNFISSITPDGKTYVLGNVYTKNGKMHSGVSMSDLNSDGFTVPREIKIKDYANLSDQVGFHLANNRKVLIMSIDHGDGLGDRDLYVSFELEGGKWSAALNMGNVINTASEESSPFLAADDKTLYFSSTGFSGMGKKDIYLSRRLDDSWQTWSEPENLGPEINSAQDDEFFNISNDGKVAYYSQGFGESKGNKDIFKVDLTKAFRPEAIVQVRGKVYNRETREPVSARIFYEQLPSGIEVGQINSDPNTGEYQILLPFGSQYGYLAEADGFLAVSSNIDLLGEAIFEEMYQDLYLVPIEVGQTIRINNIFFDFDKSDLKQESFPELNRLADFMKNHPTAEILITGHTDNVGPASYNLKLSDRRAKAVYNYLVAKEVAKERLSYKGWGEDRPAATNEQEKEGRELNRRVEFKIVKD